MRYEFLFYQPDRIHEFKNCAHSNGIADYCSCRRSLDFPRAWAFN
jgi:hypothetical protein